MRDPSRVRISGPLHPFAAGFAAELERQGYTPNSQGLQLQLAAHLSRWLADEGLDSHGLVPAEAERFVTARRVAGYTNHTSARALQPLLAYLRKLGATPPEPSLLPEGPVEELLSRYRHYLTAQRGLTAQTIRGYADAVRPFLGERASTEGLGLAELHAADVTAFVTSRCPRQARGSAKLTVTALRSLLGFLHREGMIDRLLDEHADAAVATALNEGGHRSGSGRQFSARIVVGLRRAHKLPSHAQRLRARGMLTRTEIAGRLGIHPHTVRSWERAGLVRSHRADDKNRRLFEPPTPGDPKLLKRQGVRLDRREPTESCPGGAV